MTKELIDDKPENPPAFPLPLGAMNAAEPSESGGIFLRDYFAIHAPVTMQDAERTLKDENAGFVSYAQIYKRLSQMQYAYADAMLRTRKP